MLESTQEYNFPDPKSLSERQKEQASFAYLVPFVTIIGGLPLPIVNLFVCLGYWYYVRERSPWVRFHAIQSILTTIPIVLINAGVVYLAVQLIWGDLSFETWIGGYFAAAILFNLIEFAFNIYAAIMARRGKSFLFIGFGAMAYEMVDWDEEEYEGL